MQPSHIRVSNNLFLRKFLGGSKAVFWMMPLLFATMGSPARAQSLLWAKRAGGTAIDLANAVAVDALGNSYATGRFGTTATFGPGEPNQTQLTTAGQDVFIAKYNLNGLLQWVRKVTGSVGVGAGIGVDSLGNSYVTGTFNNSLVFAPGTASELILTSAGSNDIFVAKYDTNGTLLWARRDGGTSGDTANGLALDGSGNSYVVGTFSGTATFGQGEANQTSITATGTPCTGSNMFIAKYNSNGQFQWVRRGSNSLGTGVAADAAGNIWAVGDFCGPATFNPGGAGETSLTAAVAARDFFVLKYNSSGALQWAREIDTTEGFSLDSHVATDGLENSYVTGKFLGAATFGAGGANQTVLTSHLNSLSTSSEDIFVAKFASDGALQWAKQAGSSGSDWGTGIAADSLGNSYVTGYFRPDSANPGPAIFGAGEATQTPLTSAGTEDVFLAKYNTLGQLVWARRAGGPSDDRGFGIALDSAANIHVVGRFATTAIFGLGESNQTSLTSANNFDIFVAKYANLVNCPSESLQTAVNLATAGQTILVSGTCNENVLVRNEKQRITIDGAGAGAGTRATINAPGGSPGFNVRGKGILIQNFVITGGNRGVTVNRGSNAVLNNNIIQNTGGDGVKVEQLAFAVLTNNTIENNPSDGVSVEESSTARIGFNADSDTVASPNTIQNNGGRGIKVSNGSHARIVGNTISGNDDDGIAVERDSSADIASNAINGNQRDGIAVESNSFVQLGEDSGSSIYETPNNTTVNNAGAGVGCGDGSIADGRLGTLNGNSGPTDFGGSCSNSLL